jgi:hypothetical protein
LFGISAVLQDLGYLNEPIPRIGSKGKLVETTPATQVKYQY